MKKMSKGAFITPMMSIWPTKSPMITQTTVKIRGNNINFLRNLSKNSQSFRRRSKKKVTPSIVSEENSSAKGVHTQANPSSISINQLVYNNISSIFNVQSYPMTTQGQPLPSIKEDSFAALLASVLEKGKEKAEDSLPVQFVKEVLSDEKFTMSTIMTFCGFLDKSGYSIRRKESDTNKRNVGSTTANSNEAPPTSPTKPSNSKCPHTERKHYAKNMCSSCYRREGREKKAWLCSHNSKAHYAKGLCQLCYLNKYHEKKALKSHVNTEKGNSIVNSL